MYFVLTGENMGFKLFQERMGEELYLKKLKEADEVCEMCISVRLLLLHAINLVIFSTFWTGLDAYLV